MGPIVARFDDMKTRFAAMLWDRVLLLDTFDSAQILTFFQQFGDTTEPEAAGPVLAGVPVAVGRTVGGSPSASPSGSGSAGPERQRQPGAELIERREPEREPERERQPGRARAASPSPS